MLNLRVLRVFVSNEKQNISSYIELKIQRFSFFKKQLF